MAGEVEIEERAEHAAKMDAEAEAMFDRIRAIVVPDTARDGEEFTIDKMVVITCALAQIMGSLWGAFENDDKFVALFWDAATKSARRARADYAEYERLKDRRG